MRRENEHRHGQPGAEADLECVKEQHEMAAAAFEEQRKEQWPDSHLINIRVIAGDMRQSQIVMLYKSCQIVRSSSTAQYGHSTATTAGPLIQRTYAHYVVVFVVHSNIVCVCLVCTCVHLSASQESSSRIKLPPRNNNCWLMEQKVVHKQRVPGILYLPQSTKQQRWSSGTQSQSCCTTKARCPLLCCYTIPHAESQRISQKWHPESH